MSSHDDLTVENVAPLYENEQSGLLDSTSLLDETNSTVDFEATNESLSHHKGSLTSVSLSSSSDQISLQAAKPSSLPSSPSKHIEQGIILKQLVLKGISSQLNTAHTRLNSKEATCLTVSTWISLGTRNGLVLVFDVTQNLKWFLDTLDILGTRHHSDDPDYWGNAISALAFNPDHSRILVGTARGHVLEYDMKDGTLVRTLNDVHPPENAILHLKFTDSPNLAILCDSGGNVFELGFKRTLGIRGVDTRCLFSGSRGEVCAVEPLRTYGQEWSFLIQGSEPKWESVVIVAMATLSKVLVVQIRPTTKVICSQALSTNPLSPPCIGWQFVSISSQHTGRSVDPVLAFGRHDELHFIQLRLDVERRRVRSYPLLHFQLDFKLRCLQWLDSRTLALLDSQQKVHVVDLKMRETVDVVDIAGVDLVSSAPFFQGLATGGNVSQAMALVGTQAYYNSIATCSNQLLLLCSTSLRSIGIRQWDERLDLLVSQLKPEEAIRLGLRMMDGKAKVIQGLKGNQDQRIAQLKEKEIAILNDYIEQVLVPLLGKDQTESKSTRSLRSVIELCIDVCVQLQETSLLFDQIFHLVSPVEVARITFLELLEPHFLNDRLPSIPPSVMQQFVAHYEDKGAFEALENCISHVDVTCLDLHQILTLSQNQGLYHAYLYVHTRALYDYVSPLEDLLKQLQAAVKLGPPYSEQDLRLGHIILVYLSCCLAGRAYPIGEIDEDLRVKVKHQVLTSLTCLHSKRAQDDEPPYPFLRALLEFNTQELLNALSLAFEESEFTGEMGARRQQRVIDILVEIMVNSPQFSPDQICSLFTFISRQISRAPKHDSIHLDRNLFLQLVDLLCSQSSQEVEVQSRFEERQQALLLLLQIKGQPLIDTQEEEKLLEQARAAKFHRVCEYIYERRQDWSGMFQCYVDDTSRHGDIFIFLRTIFVESMVSNMREMELLILQHIQLLVKLNATNLAVFLASERPHMVSEALSELDRTPEEKYRFLEALIGLTSNEESPVRSSSEESVWIEQYANLMADLDAGRMSSFVQSVDNQYLPLVRDICQKHSLTDAEAALLERQGDISAAYELLLSQLQNSTKKLFEQPDTWHEFHDKSQRIIDFCHRQSGTLSESEREKIWLTLLDELLSPQKLAKHKPDSSAIISGLREVTQEVVSGIQGQVNLTKVLPRLIANSDSEGTLGDLRHLLMGLLDNYVYESTLLKISTRLLQADIHGLLVQRFRQSKKGVSLRTSRCCSCSRSLDNKTSSATIAYQCMHAFHANCVPVDAKDCVVCHPVPNIAQLVLGDASQAVKESVSLTLTPNQLESVANTRRRLSEAIPLP